MTLQEALAQIEKGTISSPVKYAFRLLVESLDEELQFLQVLVEELKPKKE